MAKLLHEILDPLFAEYPNSAVACHLSGVINREKYNQVSLYARWMRMDLSNPDVVTEIPEITANVDRSIVDAVLTDPAARISAELQPKFQLNVDFDGYHFELSGSEFTLGLFNEIWCTYKDGDGGYLSEYYQRRSGSRLLLCITKKDTLTAFSQSVPTKTLQTPAEPSYPPQYPIPDHPLAGIDGAPTVNELEDKINKLAERAKQIAREKAVNTTAEESQKILEKSEIEKMQEQRSHKEAVEAMMKQALASAQPDPDHFDDDDELFDGEAAQPTPITGGRTEPVDPEVLREQNWMKMFNTLPLKEQRMVVGTDEVIPERLAKLRDQFALFSVAMQARITRLVNNLPDITHVDNDSSKS